MAVIDNRNFYIRWPGHPKYKEGDIIVDDELTNIIQKIEMILFTKKGDFIGDLDFGADIEYYLWETSVSVPFIKSQIQDQFNTYVPELLNYRYVLDVSITEGTLKDILIIDIIKNYFRFFS